MIMRGTTPNSDIDTWRYLYRSVRAKWKSVLGMMGAITVVMLIYVLIMPQKFTSTVTLLPPQKENNSLGLGSLLQGASALPMFDIGSSLGFGGRPSDIFGEILKSQSVAESLIIGHKLDIYFGVPSGKSHRHAIEPLREASEIEINKNGLIRVSVTLGTGFFPSSSEVDSIKMLAAEVANDYVLWLDRINRDKLISSARNSRQFIEQELQRTQDELDSAYAKLVSFQRTNKSVFLDKQMEAALSGATDIREKLMQARVELGVRKRDFAEHSRVIAQLQSQIDELSRQYQSMSSGAGGEDYAVPFQRVPEVARDMAGLMRDVKILEQVILYLSQQYYQDRVQEARDTPTVQVLDAAVPAIQRTSPKRAAWMLMTVFLAFLVSVGSVMLRAFFDSRREAMTAESSASIRS
jgi:tyrosine-protein kinase Etk/Wzc